MKMNVPNTLTIIRVLLIPFFVAFMLCNITAYDNYIALAIFIVASLTDTLDGYLARKNNQVTNFGKFMDPLADKLLVCSALICLLSNGMISTVVVLIIIAREFIISGFRLIASDRGMVLAAGKLGKIKTTLQIIAIVLLLLNNFPFVYIGIPMDKIVLAAAVVMTVWSGADYIVKNRQILKD